MPLTNLNNVHLSEAEVAAAKEALTELETALVAVCEPNVRRPLTLRKRERAKQTVCK